MVAFDPVNKQLLVCGVDEKWHLDGQCPGGGYARCVDGQEQTSCIGTDGG